jgi:hypothetical protein
MPERAIAWLIGAVIIIVLLFVLLKVAGMVG